MSETEVLRGTSAGGRSVPRDFVIFAKGKKKRQEEMRFAYQIDTFSSLSHAALGQDAGPRKEFKEGKEAIELAPKCFRLKRQTFLPYAATRAVDHRNILALWVALSLAAIILAVTTIFFVRLMRRKERMEALYGVARLDFRRPGDLAKSVVSKNERSVLPGDRRLEHVIDESNAARLPRYVRVADRPR